MDYTRYKFEGGIYNKRGLVLTIVQKFTSGGDKTLDEVREKFGLVIDPMKTAIEIKNRKNREFHYIKYPIQLKNDVGAVRNQWRSSRIENFVKKAVLAGYKIESVQADKILRGRYS